jgi:hypothetical protein
LARSSDDALFAVFAGPSTLGGVIGEAAGGTAFTGFVLRPDARDARLPFDSIGLILVCSICHVRYRGAQYQK